MEGSYETPITSSNDTIVCRLLLDRGKVEKMIILDYDVRKSGNFEGNAEEFLSVAGHGCVYVVDTDIGRNEFAVFVVEDIKTNPCSVVKEDRDGVTKYFILDRHEDPLFSDSELARRAEIDTKISSLGTEIERLEHIKRGRR